MNDSRTSTIGGLWDELNQGLFPWIDDNIDELIAREPKCYRVEAAVSIARHAKLVRTGDGTHLDGGLPRP